MSHPNASSTFPPPPLQSNLKGEAKSEAQQVKEYLSSRAVARFQVEHGREPDANETEGINKALEEDLSVDEMTGEVADGENAEEEDEAEAEGLVMSKVCSAFELANGRLPSTAELDDVLGNLRQQIKNSPAKAATTVAAAAASGSKPAFSFSSVVATEEQAEEESEEEAADGTDQLIEGLVDEFKKRNNRDPTEEEVKSWIDTISSANLQFVEGEEGEDAGTPQTKKQRKE